MARPRIIEGASDRDIARWLEEHLDPYGVGVVLQAEHLCMTMRGAGAVGSRTITSALRGTLLDDQRARDEFFQLTLAS